MKHELIILQGIQGSGKTTWAKNWVKEDPKHRVRFNQDDIRNMFGVYWVPSREPLVKELHDSFLNKAMLEGYDIVLDNMNLNTKVLSTIEDYVNYFNIKFADLQTYNIEYKLFKKPLQTLIDRDSKRDISVGANVITDLYNKYYDIVNCNNNNTDD